MAQTIVFKVGTSSITQADGTLDRIKITRITNQLAQLHQKGHRLVLVTSGSIAAGFRRLGFAKRPTKIAEKQASAAVGQGLLMEEYTQNLMKDAIVCAQILLTQDDFADARRYQNAHAALQVLLGRGCIPIINENDTVAIEEIRVGDNDTLSAQVAALLKADLLVLLTDVDGLYTANPASDIKARHVEHVRQIDASILAMAQGTGGVNATGGMATKLKAATIATRLGVPVFICKADTDTALLQAATQTNKGTLFAPDSEALSQKKHWMAFYARVDAGVIVDAGAAHALLHAHGSLLTAGVVAQDGSFEAGDIISVYTDTPRTLIGKGRVRCASSDLRSDTPLEGVLIHRNDWVSLCKENAI